MDVLWVVAHPEPTSLTAALHREGVDELRAAGHRVTVSDLYAMRWNPVVGPDDFPEEPAPRVVTRASRRAFDRGTLSPDIRAEQDKLDRADALVVQFPLWWYGMPAILKGWFDRVLVKGYGYGLPGRSTSRSRRYGDGRLAGRRAMAVVTTGSPAAPLAPRGINGGIDQVLFPLLHGTLFYIGMDVLPPAVVPGADRVDDEGFAGAARFVRDRVRCLPDIAPLPFRPQDGGDYDDDLVLHGELAAGGSGLDVHYATGTFPAAERVSMLGR